MSGGIYICPELIAFGEIDEFKSTQYWVDSSYIDCP
jgi:hypothetical protein